MLKNEYFEKVIMSILGVIVGIATNSFFAPIDTAWLIVGIIVFFIAIVIEVCLIIFFAKRSNNHKQDMEKKEQEISTLTNNLNKEKKLSNTYANMISDLNKCFGCSAEKIYELIEKARQTQNIDLNIWNQFQISDFVCSEIYALIKSMAKRGDDFSVSYIVTEYDKNQQKQYFMASYDGYETARPHIYMESIPEADAKKYYFGQMFKKNNPAVSYLLTQRAIINKFYFSNESDKLKYSQYIGIPVYCSGHKMVGLLQIVAHNGSIIESNENQMKRLVNTFIMGYAKLILFSEKVQKGITLVP